MPSNWSALKHSASQDSSVFGDGASETERGGGARNGGGGRSHSRGTSPDAAPDDATSHRPIEQQHHQDANNNSSMSPTYLTLSNNASMYVVTGSPPPLGGQGAPRTPNEFLNISVGTTRKNADATGKDVIWYDVTIRTTTHQWTVSKRFSDFAQVHETLRRLRLDRFLSDVVNTTTHRQGNESARSQSSARSASRGGGGGGAGGRAESSPSSPGETEEERNRGYRHGDFPPPFPSRFSFRSNMASSLVEQRRVQLDVYWNGVLRYLQALTLAAIGIKKPYSAALRSAFAVMTDFLRTSSQTESTETGLWVKDDGGDPYQNNNSQSNRTIGGSSSPQSIGGRAGGSPNRCGGGGGGAMVFGSPLTTSSKMIFGGPEDDQQQPPCKIILEAKTRFTIVFFLPGVLLGDVYVDATGDRDRAVVIGGRWNRNIAGLESLREQGVFHHNNDALGGSGSGMSGGRSIDDSSLASSTLHQQQQQQRDGSNDATTNTTNNNNKEKSMGSARSGGRRTPVAGGGGGTSSRRPPERSVLMDTLPRGEFEMIFDVPLPFERAHWYSEYEGGVLLIMWDAPTGGGGGGASGGRRF